MFLNMDSRLRGNDSSMSLLRKQESFLSHLRQDTMADCMRFLVLALFLVIGACAPGSDKVTSPVPLPEQKQEAQKARAAWETEWERWMGEARKEGKVVLLITGETAPHNAVKEGFEKKYGIKVELTSVGVGLVEGKLISERRAGVHTTDLFFAGGTATISVKSTGAFDPMGKIPVLPEAIDPKMWWRGKLDYIDKDNFILAFLATPGVSMAINTELIKPADEPRSWKELLNPGWKNKIIMGDARITGTANTNFTFIAHYRPDLGLDFWRELAKQEPVIIRDQRLQVDWLAKSKYPVLIAPPPTLKQFSDAGAPVRYHMLGGMGYLSSASGNAALVNKALHPNAAKIYINYLLTREAQTLYSIAGGFQSGRVDVPTNHLDPFRVRQPGMDYLFASYEDFALKAVESMKDAMEIFGR